MKQQPSLGALYGATAEATTFLGLDACTDIAALTAPIAILGAPCATPYRSVGAYCRNGPDALRKASAAMAFNIERHDFESGGTVFPQGSTRAVDCGNLPFDEAKPQQNRTAIRDAVGMIIERGAIPILLGGDDSVPIPMLQGIGDKAGEDKFTILQIDAHIDWRDVHMDEREGLSSTMRRASEMLHIERIIQVGARGIGTASTQDYEDARAWGVSFVTAQELHAAGPRIIEDMIPRESRLIICIDADAVDPATMPGVIGRAPGGLSYFQIVDLLDIAASRGQIAAMDFVEFMPERDVDGIGALTFARLITTSLGIISRQLSAGQPTGALTA